MAAFGAAPGNCTPPPPANRRSGLVSTGPERVRQGPTLAPLRASSPVLPPPACGPHPRMAAFGAAPGNCTPPPPANRPSGSVSTGPERVRQGMTLAPLRASSPVLPPPACGPHPRMAAFGAGGRNHRCSQVCWNSPRRIQARFNRRDSPGRQHCGSKSRRCHYHAVDRWPCWRPPLL